MNAWERIQSDPEVDRSQIYPVPCNAQDNARVGIVNTLSNFKCLILGPVYAGPDKFGTGPLWDLIGSAPKLSHESGPKLFQIARPFTWDRIVHQIAKIIAVFVERHLVVEDESPPKSQNIEE